MNSVVAGQEELEITKSTNLIWPPTETSVSIPLLLTLLGPRYEMNTKDVVDVRWKHNLRHLQYASKH